MKNRREFIKLSALGSAAMLTGTSAACQSSPTETQGETIPTPPPASTKPIVLSTWNHGMMANKEAWTILSENGNALDAVEKGVRIVESDPTNSSVGIGGLPDREGIVTLDACIMDQNNKCGSVAFLQDIENPISVARKVMEETPHVMLVGQGAYQFAMEQGFERKNLLTPEAKKSWEKWKEESKYKPEVNSENHDTIGMIALDAQGNLSGACTTSGMAYKLHGRVGDSPLIGAGLFVDNEVGAACATGVGEAIIRVSGSSMVVELMRQGKSPQEACTEMVNRIIEKHENLKNLQVGFLALNKKGEYGGAAIYSGFNYALKTNTQEVLIDTEYAKEW
jgi:isoaspartyl peptidase/L-asparaginase-like protein (Ntn-hydrolase superfamily)